MSDPVTPTAVGKLKRSHLLHYINANIKTNDENPAWFLIGKDIDDMSVNLNPQTEVVKNIWDETSTNDNGYEPSVDAETYYANTNDSIYAPLRNIAMNRLTGDDCRTDFLEVLIEDDGETHAAWRENVVLKPQSYGGPTGGVNIPYNISFDGNRKSGTASITIRVPTFIPA